MRYSRTALKVLKARYLSILKKCALINAGLFVLAAPAEAMQIFVETAADEQITLDVEPTDKIEDVIAKIQEQEGISPGIYQLSFADKILEAGNMLQDYSIQKDSTLHIKFNAVADAVTGTDFSALVQADTTEQINLKNDITLDTAAGEQGAKSIIINGNRHDISAREGNNDFSITTRENETLEINNVGDKNNPASKGFNGFSGGHGGVITVYDGTLTVNNSVFTDNQASQYGGAVHSQDSTVTISNSVFSRNKASEMYGGAINGDNGTLTVSDSTFDGNEAQSGGAILGGSDSLSITNSIFTNNKATNDGSAIAVTGDKAVISNSKFIGNSAGRFGGAILNYGTDAATISDSIFEGNTANGENAQGGAIFARDMDIIANASDTVFTGNTVNGKSNALYVANYRTVNLNAGDHKIIFNDGIDGDEGATININKSGVAFGDSTAPTDGIVEFNNLVENNTVNLYSGTLKLGSYAGGEVNGKTVAASSGSFDSSVNFNVHGGKLDLTDGEIRETNLGNVNLQENLELGIDVALTDEKADTIKADSVSGDGKINISDFNILNDTDKNVVEVAVTEDDKLYNALSLGKTNVSVGDDVQKNYLITYGNGKLKFGNDQSLETAVKLNTSPERAYVMSRDEKLTGDLGQLAGESLSVSGNGHTIDGNGYWGFEVSSDQTLTLNDITLTGFSREPVSNWGILNLAANNYDTTINGEIFGDGTVNIGGSKTVTLNGNVNLGMVNLTSGRLVLGNEEVLHMAEKFTATGGTLDIGTQHIRTDDATFENGSTLAVTVNPDEHGVFEADKLAVKDGAKLSATLAQGLVDRSTGPKTFTLVSADDWTEADEESNGDNFILAHDNNMYKFEKTDVAGEYVVSLVQTAEEVSQSSGGTANNANTANAWVDGGKFPDGSPAQDLANNLAGLAQKDAKGFNDALTALAPEVSPVVKTASVDHSNQVFNAVSTRMSGGVVGSAAEGKSSGDSALDGGATWVQLLANKTEFDGNGKAHGFDSKSAGIALGAEKQINGEVKAGAGYAYTSGDIDAFMRDIDVDTHTVFAYGEYKPNNWFVNGVASYSFSDYDERKNVAGSRYKAKYDVDNIGLQAMTGYDTELNNVDVTPVAGLRYNRIHRDGYTDSVGQRVSSDTMDVLTAVAGVKVGKDFATGQGMLWRPEARVAMTYDLVSDKENAVVGLTNGFSYFVEGERLDRFGIEAGLGLTVDVNDNLEAVVGYEGRFREDYTDHTGMISAKYKF